MLIRQPSTVIQLTQSTYLVKKWELTKQEIYLYKPTTENTLDVVVKMHYVACKKA